VGGFLATAVEEGVPNAETTLYIVWGGSNDFLIGHETESSVVVDNISSVVTDLVGLAGARHLLVLNMPPLAGAPAIDGGLDSFFVAEGHPPNLADLVDEFNTGLGAALQTHRAENEGLRIYEVDVFSLLETVLADPGEYGFNANVGIPVLNESVLYGTQVGPLFLNDPATALFWDGVHPTTRAHSIVAAEAARILAIPEPTTFSAVVATVLAVSILRWARKELIKINLGTSNSETIRDVLGME
jgi:phospholipase/lecithinase/hemolysin